VKVRFRGAGGPELRNRLRDGAIRRDERERKKGQDRE
jgi:hypothetical protein